MALWFRVTFAIWLVLVLALSLSLFLNHAKFDSTYTEMSRSRFQVLAQDVRNGVESGLELGLGLGELRSPQQMVERAEADAVEIHSVVVADIRGAVLFDSDGVKEDKLLPVSQVAAIVAVGQRGRAWSQMIGDEALLGLPILNPFQVAVGVVVLRYDARFVAAVKGRALYDMLKAMLVIVAILTVITAPLVMWSFGGVRRTFGAMLVTAAEILPAEALMVPTPLDEGPHPSVEGDADDATLVANDGAEAAGVTDDTLEAEFGAFARSAVGTLDRLRIDQSR